MAETGSSEFRDFQGPDEASFDKLVAALDRAYHRPWQMLWRSFWQGFMAAIGATIGTGVILILIGYAVHLLGGVELFRPLIDQFQNSITNAVDKSGLPNTVSTSPTPTVTPR